jgi:putative endonuclease
MWRRTAISWKLRTAGHRYERGRAMGTEEGRVRRASGLGAEQRAAAFLEEAGYCILDRNFRCRYGEIDLVVERGELLCFVEVRMRSSATWGDPSQTVSLSKQRRIVKTALHYLIAHAISNRMLRFDVIAIIGQGAEARVEHLPGAFDAGM